jgi:hypothetical protein
LLAPDLHQPQVAPVELEELGPELNVALHQAPQEFRPARPRPLARAQVWDVSPIAAHGAF